MYDIKSYEILIKIFKTSKFLKEFSENLKMERLSYSKSYLNHRHHYICSNLNKS